MLIPKITYSESDVNILPQPNYKKDNSIDRMIDILKNIAKKSSPNGAWKKELDKLDKKHGEISVEEFWSILSDEDKKIFSNDISVFSKWAFKLEKKQTGYYLERLLGGMPLIPPFEGFDSNASSAGVWPTSEPTGPTYNDNEDYSIDEVFDGEKDFDYENRVVISFIDNLTCISNYDLQKINRIKFQLLRFGILETEIRMKQIEDKTLYTLVYDSQQNINKIDWN